MDEEMSGTVSRVFCEVLNRQVFMFADPEEGGFEPGEGGFLATSIGFRGESLQGEITLALPEAIVGEIAANFLGMDADDPFVTARRQDACKELLNVTCGHILTALKGEGPVFDLTIPEVASVEGGQVADWAAAPDALPFSVDGSPVLLRIRFSPSPPAGA